MNGDEALSPQSTLPVFTLTKPDLLDVDRALECEWLVTNGIGGYASGTALTVDTRRYHGLLVAAVRPPVGRTLLLARVHETVSVQRGDDNYSLHTVEYHDGTLNPVGHIFLQEFRLEGTLPVWCYRCREVEIERTLWLEHGRNTLFIRYTLLAGDRPVRLRLEPFAACRDCHASTQGSPDWRFDVSALGDCCRVEAFQGATPLWIRVPKGSFVETGLWYWKILHRRERERGYHDHLEDLYTPGVFGVDLHMGQPVTLVATIHPEDLDLDAEQSLRRERSRQERLLEMAGVADGDPVRGRLVLAADRFLGARGDAGRTIFAGFHWFDEQSRDAMISVAGLCLATGRREEARSVLTTFASHLYQGLLPHNFPNSGRQPQYDVLDPTLWMFEAIARYEGATGDRTLVDDLLPQLEDAVSWYERGTLCGIGVDPADGLLQGVAPGFPLTWMDAQFCDWVVTPRRGKPVEIQALWYNALRLLAGWKADRNRESTRQVEAADRCRASFNRRFWNAERSCCLDVIDGPEGDDPSLRPNQLFAISLTHPILDPDRWESVLATVDSNLLTPFGLRSLAPSDPRYRGHYRADQLSRDCAYHQGTVWPWLLATYVDAARRVRGEAWDHLPLLRPLVEHSSRNALGQPSEVFDGDWPHTPGGCIARAWSAAELLRIWPNQPNPRN